jgi:hypothetical protein
MHSNEARAVSSGVEGVDRGRAAPAKLFPISRNFRAFAGYSRKPILGKEGWIYRSHLPINFFV